MRPLLITGYGTSISVDKRKLIISNKLDKLSLEFYPHQVPYDNVIVDGNYGLITFEAIRWLMKHDITLTTLNWNGNLLSVTLPKEPSSGKSKIEQYKKYIDDNERYRIADEIIKEKVRQSLSLLVTLSEYYNNVDKTQIKTYFSKELTLFSRNTSGQPIKKRLNALMTYEARIADIYWITLSKVFNSLYSEFNFTSRKAKSYSWNNNASDPVNALLNYGYSLLESLIRTDINTIGLDQAIGFLHEIAPSKTPLVYDIQELYRWIVDLSVIQLLEEKKLKKSDFIVTENYNIRLKDTTAKALIDKIMLNFNKTAEYKGKFHSYEYILFDNVRTLSNYIVGNATVLLFSIPTVELNRNDQSELRDKILSIDAEGRKKLGINKSTLWYMQKNIKE